MQMPMERRLDRMGVLILLSHLLITLSFIGVYVFTLQAGQEDETIKTILTVIVGYWFGSMGTDAIKKRVVERNTDKERKI